MNSDQASVYLQHLMDFNAVPIITWSADGGILSANDAYLKLIGYTREDLEAKRINWRALTPPAYNPVDEDALRQLESAPIAAPYVKEYVRKDGARITVRLFSGRDTSGPGHGISIVLGE